MSFQALSERLNALQETNVQLKDLIDRLATIKFQPGSVPLDNEEGNAMSELTGECAQIIKDQSEDFEILHEEILDLSSGRKGSELEQQKIGLVEADKRSRKELNALQTAFRRAMLSARRSLVAAQKEERQLLLQTFLEPRSSNASPVPGQQRLVQRSTPLSKEEKTLNASSDVTAALRRTHDSMASELSRSQFAHDTLKESTTALAELSETYSTLDTMLSSSKNLLGTLLRSQKSDTWYLETAFYILLATIAWLVWRRLLYGPTWWLVWFPMKMFIKGWMGVFTAMGLRGGSDITTTSSLSSIASSPTPVEHRKATRGSVTPSVPPGGHVRVGGGGKGGPMKRMDAAQDSKDSLSEKVGRIIDENQDEEATSPDEPESETQRNPKKRMWEEEPEGIKDRQGNKDEL